MIPTKTLYRWLTLACLSIITVSHPIHGESVLSTSSSHERFDTLLLGGMVYSGELSPPRRADVGIIGDRIVSIGALSGANADTILDVSGLAVAPGFINSLSWASDTLLVDGRGQSNIRQGVTLEVFGEGNSMGPLNDEQRRRILARQGDLKYPIPWTTLGESLQHLERLGVTPNVASFVGATTVRTHVLGWENRAPNPTELKKMQALVAQAMREGALGVGSSLIYAPASYASTEELVSLVATAADYGGMYISHLRSEGDRLLEAIEELINIARLTGAPAEIYHLKVAGQDNWSKFNSMQKLIEQAQADGLQISANMYTYTAGSTGLDAAMPPWVQEGGLTAWIHRLQDPGIRSRVAAEMVADDAVWENLLAQATPAGTLLVGFKNPQLRNLIGKTLAEVAHSRNKPPHEVAMDLVVEDGSRVQVVYFLMSEENVTKTIALPWVTFGSDAGSYSAEGVFLRQSTHPRAYGNFARVLGRYSRERKLLSLTQAVHRLAYLPAQRFKLVDRGLLREGYYADIAIFDPATISDHATYENPHQYATGMHHVLVNGQFVLRDGDHTGATPGRFVRGPGWQGSP